MKNENIHSMENISCDLCDSNNSTLLYIGKDRMFKKKGLFNIAKCNNCGLIYINPRPTEEKIMEFYPNEYAPYNIKKNRIIKLVKERLIKNDIKQLKKIIKRSGRILEIGCATGEYLLAIKNTGRWEVHGVEISSYASKYAREKFDLNVITGTVFDATFPNEYFDAVIMNHVLEHVPNPSETITEINRILRKSGKFIFVIPNIDSYEAKIFEEYWYGLDVPRHLYNFSPKTLREILQKCNFEIQNIYHISIPNQWIGSLKYFFVEKRAPSTIIKFFNINNVFLLLVFTPISFLLSILGKSGRIKIMAKKRGENTIKKL